MVEQITRITGSTSPPPDRVLDGRHVTIHAGVETRLIDWTRLSGGERLELDWLLHKAGIGPQPTDLRVAA